MTNHYFISFIFLSACLLGCQPSEDKVEKVKPLKPNQKQSIMQAHLDQFEQWKKTQNPVELEQYQNYFNAHLKQKPTLFELTYNSHPLGGECEKFRFSLPPKSLWKNLLPTLQLIEKLQLNGVYDHYKIVSVYRSQEANSCVKGAQKSKHLKNYAVDFQTLDQNFKPYADTDLVEQRLCEFWRKEGRQYRLGLGVYGKQRFHIDTQGYRTWGVGYKSVSSPCLKSNNSTR